MWIKAAASASAGQCFEVNRRPDGFVEVRHSKDPLGPILTFTPDEWRAAGAGFVSGEFDYENLRV
jgi:hypothetical protein